MGSLESCEDKGSGATSGIITWVFTWIIDVWGCKGQQHVNILLNIKKKYYINSNIVLGSGHNLEGNGNLKNSRPENS